MRRYGIIDTGIIVENNRNGVNGTECTAREEFGVNLGPRVGLVANEDLGNGLKVKMQLESLFESDNGAMRFNRLFGGESSLAVIGRFGEFAAGRMGALTSPFGHWGMFGLEATPFGFGWGRAGGVHWMQGGDRLDNALSWASPELAGGLTLYAQYSFPNEAGQPIPRVCITMGEDRKGVTDLYEKLLNGSPRILTGLEDNRLYINPMTLKPGEMEIVLKRLTEILEEK